MRIHQMILVRRERPAGPDAFALRRLVPAFDLAIRQRIAGRRPHVRHAGLADQLLEVPCDKLRSVVGDNPRPGLRVRSRAAWRLISMSLSVIAGRQIPVHDETAEVIQHGAQIVERSRDADAGNIDVPVLLRHQRLLEAGTFHGRLRVPLAQQSGLAQHAPDAGGLTATMSRSSSMNVGRR